MDVPAPKRLTAEAGHSHRRSKVQERKTAERFGATVTKRSGAGAFEKGDVRLKGVMRLEAKTTRHKSFSVTTEMIGKIEDTGAMAGEIPVIEVELDNEAHPVRVYVVPCWAIEALLGEGK